MVIMEVTNFKVMHFIDEKSWDALSPASNWIDFLCLIGSEYTAPKYMFII